MILKPTDVKTREDVLNNVQILTEGIGKFNILYDKLYKNFSSSMFKDTQTEVYGVLRNIALASGITKTLFRCVVESLNSRAILDYATCDAVHVCFKTRGEKEQLDIVRLLNSLSEMKSYFDIVKRCLSKVDGMISEIGTVNLQTAIEAVRITLIHTYSTDLREGSELKFQLKTLRKLFAQTLQLFLEFTKLESTPNLTQQVATLLSNDYIDDNMYNEINAFFVSGITQESEFQHYNDVLGSLIDNFTKALKVHDVMQEPVVEPKEQPTSKARVLELLDNMPQEQDITNVLETYLKSSKLMVLSPDGKVMYNTISIENIDGIPTLRTELCDEAKPAQPETVATTSMFDEDALNKESIKFLENNGKPVLVVDGINIARSFLVKNLTTIVELISTNRDKVVYTSWQNPTKHDCELASYYLGWYTLYETDDVRDACLCIERVYDNSNVLWFFK